MRGIYKIAAATPRLHLGESMANAREIIEIAENAAARGVSAIVFPELSVTGYGCGDLFYREELLAGAWSALETIVKASAKLPLVLIVGLPVREGAGIYNGAAVVYKGKLWSVVKKRVLADYGEYYEKRQFLPASADDTLDIFKLGPLTFGVEICEDLWSAAPPSSFAVSGGADVIFNLSASTDFLGKAARRREMALQQSSRLVCAYAMACAGTGESTADAVYGGASLIASDGAALCEAKLFGEEPKLVSACIDVEALGYRRRRVSSVRPGLAKNTRLVVLGDDDLAGEPERVSPSPFLDEYGEENWTAKLLDIQAVALSRRMTAAHSKRLVIGVSGGADSALALIGANRALRRLGLPADNLIAVVMPGFGSSVRTQNAAVKLSTAIGATVRVIDIKNACSLHLADIGHDTGIHDLAYENVQARERTQLLMDIANMEGALVIGTGDLSEIALGWNTYNGDHISMYQLNASVPKTMVLATLREVAAVADEPLASLLKEIAASPITPELVPGAAANDSENRLGPYELHDFFLYHYIANGAGTDKLLELAKIAFAGKYSADVIKRTLDTFIRRFKTSQYKRNCVPDGPKITLSLSPRADWRMPSDLS